MRRSPTPRTHRSAPASLPVRRASRHCSAFATPACSVLAHPQQRSHLQRLSINGSHHHICIDQSGGTTLFSMRLIAPVK